MNRVIWSDLALDQLEAIKAYVGKTSPQAAEHLTSELIRLGNALVDFPYRGRLVVGTARRDLVTVYPYIIRYRIDGVVIRILRVRHTSRRPTES